MSRRLWRNQTLAWRLRLVRLMLRLLRRYLVRLSAAASV